MVCHTEFYRYILRYFCEDGRASRTALQDAESENDGT